VERKRNSELNLQSVQLKKKTNLQETAEFPENNPEDKPDNNSEDHPEDNPENNPENNPKNNPQDVKDGNELEEI